MRLGSLLAALPVVGAAALVRPRQGCAGAGKSLYFLDNNPSGASIVSARISDQDGTLSNPVRTSTGGIGLSGTTATGNPTEDSLFSQDVVAVSNSHLLTVSPGSNTASLFAIKAHDPSRPVPVGKPVSTGGEFPNSVAISDVHQLACVLNTGAVAGVSCFRVTSCGLSPVGALMPLAGFNQSTPPLGPTSTASDILFNPSQTALFVSVKGDGKVPGSIYAYPVQNGSVVPQPVVSQPKDLLVDFGMSFLDDARAVVTDAASGASLVQVSYPSLEVAVTAKTTVAGQVATCWATYSPEFDAVYIFDVGSPNATALDPRTGAIKYTIPGLPEAQGLLDAVVVGGHLYVAQAAAGISVYSLAGTRDGAKTPALVQNFNLSSLGSRQGFQGLAAFLG